MKAIVAALQTFGAWRQGGAVPMEDLRTRMQRQITFLRWLWIGSFLIAVPWMFLGRFILAVVALTASAGALWGTGVVRRNYRQLTEAESKQRVCYLDSPQADRKR